MCNTNKSMICKFIYFYLLFCDQDLGVNMHLYWVTSVSRFVKIFTSKRFLERCFGDIICRQMDQYVVYLVIFIFICKKTMSCWLSGYCVRLSDHGFAPQTGHTKDHHKNGTNCLPA